MYLRWEMEKSTNLIGGVGNTEIHSVTVFSPHTLTVCGRQWTIQQGARYATCYVMRRWNVFSKEGKIVLDIQYICWAGSEVFDVPTLEAVKSDSANMISRLECILASFDTAFA